MLTPPDISVVIVGRNEGERLLRCIRSIQAAHWGPLRHDIWYVDSRSTDGSAAHAAAIGAHVVVVPAGPQCAARARNLGWQTATGNHILFLDGDTQLHPDFIERAWAALQQPSICAVWGHRRESDPDQSIYTRVLDLDWVYAPGLTDYFGGDVLIRRAALQETGGFDDQLNAGEEPELCARLRRQGWKILHIDAPMTRHDLAIKTLRAYLRRCYRSGIAYAEVAHRMHLMDDALWQREARRDFLHGALYVLGPWILLLAGSVHLAWVPTLLTLAMGVLMRSAWRCRHRADDKFLLALQYAVHSHVQKIPALFGQLAWKLAHRRAHRLALVDYKE